jgi:predicted nucleic acid-binding protein
MKNLVIDTGFWFALYEARDNNHAKALSIWDDIDTSAVRILCPWPILYETLNTRFASRHLFTFQAIIDHLIKLDDSIYRMEALSELINRPAHRLSLVDAVLRKILEDTALAVSGILTFNVSDFYDVCKRRRIEIINN